MRTSAKSRSWRWLIAALLSMSLGDPCRAQDSDGLFSAGVPTFGGLWMWSDVVIHNDWRIQQHARTGHYRLIDPRERRHESGDFETCLKTLDAIKVERALGRGPTDVVIVVHGLGANRAIMSGLCEYLSEKGGLAVVNFGYPSTMLDIGTYAQSLDSVVRHFDGVETVSFVAHSMGNIVVRKYLKDVESLAPAFRPQVAFRRMVMLSPPNHGAEIADEFTEREMTREISEWATGDAVSQLAPSQGWTALEPLLATPSFEFGIIAGGKGDDEGFLSVIPGDDDGMLSVETMKLAGAVDFLQVDCLHQLMPRDEAARAATLSFLKEGYFVTKESRRPIVAVGVETPPPVAAR